MYAIQQCIRTAHFSHQNEADIQILLKYNIRKIIYIFNMCVVIKVIVINPKIKGKNCDIFNYIKIGLDRDIMRFITLLYINNNEIQPKRIIKQ